MRARTNREWGFSLIEVAVGLSVVLVTFTLVSLIAGQAQQSLAAGGDAYALASRLSQVRMLAVGNLTHARLNCDLAGRTCQVELLNRATNTFQAADGALQLSPGMSFGSGSMKTPAGEQSTLQQTAQIVFSSRGVPIDTTGAPTGNDALYIVNQDGLAYAVTASQAGQVGVWQGAGSVWKAR